MSRIFLVMHPVFGIRTKEEIHLEHRLIKVVAIDPEASTCRAASMNTSRQISIGCIITESGQNSPAHTVKGKIMSKLSYYDMSAAQTGSSSI